MHPALGCMKCLEPNAIHPGQAVVDQLKALGPYSPGKLLLAEGSVEFQQSFADTSDEEGIVF